MFKPGDRVAISCNPSIVLSRYDRLKPSGVVSRELTDDEPIEDQLREIEADVRKLTVVSLGADLDLKTEIEQLIEGAVEPLQALKDFCVREIGHANVKTGEARDTERPQKRVQKRTRKAETPTRRKKG